MAHTPPNPVTEPHDPLAPEDPALESGYFSDDTGRAQPWVDAPRLIDEHHVVGPYGEDEIEATDDRGRRWYHLRPEPRCRADFIGFNYTWWIVIWIFVVIIVFLPWGRGWGY